MLFISNALILSSLFVKLLEATLNLNFMFELRGKRNHELSNICPSITCAPLNKLIIGGDV